MLDWLRRFIALLVLVAALSGCLNSPSAPTPAPVATEPTLPQAEPVRVAVLAIRSAVAAQAEFGPLMTYLSETLGRPVELVPVDQESQFTAVEGGQVDFTFNNPLAAVQLQRLYNTQLLVTITYERTGSQLGGLIIARPNDGIVSLDDLVGKRATCVAFETAAAGCIFQVYHMLQAGLDPYTVFSSFTETPSQDNIVLGVLNGTFDVGFVRTGQLEKMVQEGTLDSVEELQIVDRQVSDYYYPHTTRLYPEWPLAALADADPVLIDQVRAALLALPTGHPALVSAKASGFVAAVNYQPIEDLIETFQLPSWDAPTGP